jgi:serine/threonine-protein kinase
MTPDTLTATAKQRVGQILRGKWRIDGLLGVGGMASVFAATHRNGKRVAVKILHPHVAVDPSIRERFLREGYVANSIGHDGAVSVLDDDTTEDGTVFLVMELLEGETLDARAQRLGGRLSLGEVVRLGEELLEVLAAAHAKGIVHRDIKPENIFLTMKGQLKVLDFGIARLLELAGAASATRTGSMLGTPAFMPPEQALGYVKEIDGRSDIWAVGATMFTLLSGRTVHDGTTVNELLIAAATKPVVSISAVMPDLPFLIAHAIDRALAFDKARRWEDAGAMLEAIRDASEATLVASPQAAAPLILGTVASAPRRSQLVSSPDLASRTPSGSLESNPQPHTVNAMAVGRTLPEPTPHTATRSSTNLMLVAATGGIVALTVLIAIAWVVVASRDQSKASATALVSSTSVSFSSQPSQPPPERDTSLSPSALPTVGAARLDVLAQGGSCTVSIGGVQQGTTPLRALEVDPGVHEVRCVSEGFTDVRKVNAREGETQRVTFVIGKAASKPPPPAAPPKPEPTAPAAPPPPPPPPATTKPPKATNPLDMR